MCPQTGAPCKPAPGTGTLKGSACKIGPDLPLRFDRSSDYIQLMAIVASKTTASRVHEALRLAILEGAFGPGERLRTETLAERFGASRTPIREALLMLERDGLVELLPRRGAVVSSFDIGDLLDLYEVRALLEPHAAALAAERMTPETIADLQAICRSAEQLGVATSDAVEAQIRLNEDFHRVVVQAAGSARLTAALRSVADIPRAFRAAFWRSSDQAQRSLYCHREIVKALQARQPRLAEAVMQMHILGATEFLMEVTRGEQRG